MSKGKRRGRRGRRGRTERKIRRHPPPPPPENVEREEVIGGERAVRSEGGGRGLNTVPSVQVTAASSSSPVISYIYNMSVIYNIYMYMIYVCVYTSVTFDSS